MATRFYISYNGLTDSTVFDPPLTLTEQGSWTSDLHIKYAMAPDTHANLFEAGFTTRTITSGSVVRRWHATLISPPIDGAYSFDGTTTYEMCIRCQEGSTSQNCFLRCCIYFVSNDGTVQVVRAAENDAVEFTTSLTSKDNDMTGGITYTTSPGDRMIVEIGWDQQGAVSASMGMQYGYSNTAGDLVGSGDAGVQNPWFETSVTMGFDPEGTTYGNTPSRLMLLGVG